MQITTQSGLGISLKDGKTGFYFITFPLFYYSWYPIEII